MVLKSIFIRIKKNGSTKCNSPFINDYLQKKHKLIYAQDNTVEDPFGRICIPNKLEYVNLKVFDMIEGINDLKALSKHLM